MSDLVSPVGSSYALRPQIRLSPMDLGERERMGAENDARTVLAYGKPLAAALGREGAAFLRDALGSVLRILPHTSVTKWKARQSAGETRVKWVDNNRRAISVNIQISVEDRPYCVSAEVSRRAAPSGVGHIKRTLDSREFDLCKRVADRISDVLRAAPLGGSSASLRAIQSVFDQHVVAAHLQQHHGIHFELAVVLAEFRRLAERSYESKSLSFGLLIEEGKNEADCVFPSDFFSKKRYRALSDGYKTAFVVNSYGRLEGLRDLSQFSPGASEQHFYPEWCEKIAEASAAGACGIALTRQGDILIFDSGNLRFTCRSGQWQYWNHSHVCDLFRNTARVQRVPIKVVPQVVRAIYRVALDVSFRRSGALFVLLRNRKNKARLVVPGDGIGDAKREPLHALFDETLTKARVQTMSRAVLAELASIDGGVVMDNQGFLLAYGAVLKTSGRFNPSEGSRTKAAVSASHWGISVKVSSDGDIVFFADGNPFLEL